MGGCFGSSDSEKGLTDFVKKRTIQNNTENADPMMYMDNGDSLWNLLELHISCKNLPNLDKGSLSDPFVVAYLKSKQSNNQFVKIGETEIIQNNLNPKFVQSISMKYFFEERQLLKFEVYDIDDEKQLHNFSRQDFIGSCELYVHEIIRAKKNIIEKPLENSKLKKNGSIEIKGDQLESNGSSNVIQMKIQCQNILGKKHLFFKISRAESLDSQNFIPIYRSEVIRNSEKWKPLNLRAFNMIRDDPNWTIRIEIFSWNPKGNHEQLLQKDTIFAELQRSMPANWNTKYGTIQISQVELVIQHSFLDFVLGGTNISLIVAIDYTASNGNPNDPSSLHYFDMSSNQYLKAIQSVGSILECYDTDKMIPTLGFGARLPQPINVTHCFAANGNIFNPEVFGIAGVMDTYRNSLAKVSLSGPTNFSPIINYVNNMISSNFQNAAQNEFDYYILLIITDGMIMDLEPTKDAIVMGSSLPLSIVIVGVGNEDFTEMEVLDADDDPLYSQKYKKYMERDIVQFVPFAKYVNDPEQLAKETLAEIPRQLVEYSTKNHISPPVQNTIISHMGTMASSPYQQPTTENFFQIQQNEIISRASVQGIDPVQEKYTIFTKSVNVKTLKFKDIILESFYQKAKENPKFLSRKICLILICLLFAYLLYAVLIGIIYGCLPLSLLIYGLVIPAFVIVGWEIINESKLHIRCIRGVPIILYLGIFTNEYYLARDEPLCFKYEIIFVHMGSLLGGLRICNNWRIATLCNLISWVYHFGRNCMVEYEENSKLTSNGIFPVITVAFIIIVDFFLFYSSEYMERQSFLSIFSKGKEAMEISSRESSDGILITNNSEIKYYHPSLLQILQINDSSPEKARELIFQRVLL